MIECRGWRSLSVPDIANDIDRTIAGLNVIGIDALVAGTDVVCAVGSSVFDPGTVLVVPPPQLRVG